MRKAKSPKSLIDKVRELDPTFADTVYSLSDADAREKMVTMAKHASEVEEAKKADEDLARARETLKTMNQTYSEPLKAIRLKTRLLVQMLKERGKL